MGRKERKESNAFLRRFKGPKPPKGANIKVPDDFVAGLLKEPMTVLFCVGCGHTLLRRGKPRRQKCPNCGFSMTYSAGQNFDDATERFAADRLGEGAPSPSKVQAGIATALERFKGRQSNRYRAMKVTPEGKSYHFAYKRLEEFADMEGRLPVRPRSKHARGRHKGEPQRSVGSSDFAGDVSFLNTWVANRKAEGVPTKLERVKGVGWRLSSQGEVVTEAASRMKLGAKLKKVVQRG